MLSVPRRLMFAGLALIVATGVIHAVEAPDYLSLERYIGFLFVANAVGALIVALGISRGSRAAWMLGIAVAGGAFVGFILARTTGLPGGFKETEWSTLGIASLVIEAAYCLVAARALSRAPQRRAPARATGRPIGVS
jgi:hypothetical protein